LPLPVMTFGGAVSPLQRQQMRVSEAHGSSTRYASASAHREWPEPSSRTTSGVTR
jgi:hypothetical protein